MKNKKILIVDFDKLQLSSLASFFQEKGFLVFTAPDGLSAWEIIKSERPDAIIIEPMLPKLHGFELCKKISKDSIEKVPVVILTSVYRDSFYKTEAIKNYGVSAYLEKPAKKEDLLNLLLQLMEKPKSREEIFRLKEGAKEPKKKLDMDIEKELELALSAVEEEHKKKKEEKEIYPEIDRLLETTLLEVGLEIKKKRTGLREKEEAPLPSAEKKFERIIEEKNLPLPQEKPIEEKEELPKRAPFAEFMVEKKKKSILPLLTGVFAGVLLLVSVWLILLKPKKPIPPSSESSLLPSRISETSLSFEKESPLALGNIDKVQAPSLQEKPQETKETEAPEPAETSTTGEVAQPELPPPALQLKLSEPPSLKFETLKKEAEQPSQNKEVTSTETPPASQTIKEGDLVPLIEVDSFPVTIKTVEPQYPDQALRMGIEGVVVVDALISETGDVIQTRIARGVKGSFGFERASELAVRQWKFKPAEKNGVKVKVWKPISVIFKKK